MRLRDEMWNTTYRVTHLNKTDYGKFSAWWHSRIGRHSVRGGTYIRIMLTEIESDEELELLWARWNIEKEN